MQGELQALSEQSSGAVAAQQAQLSRGIAIGRELGEPERAVLPVGMSPHAQPSQPSPVGTSNAEEAAPGAIAGGTIRHSNQGGDPLKCRGAGCKVYPHANQTCRYCKDCCPGAGCTTKAHRRKETGGAASAPCGAPLRRQQQLLTLQQPAQDYQQALVALPPFACLLPPLMPQDMGSVGRCQTT